MMVESSTMLVYRKRTTSRKSPLVGPSSLLSVEIFEISEGCLSVDY